MNTEAFLLIGNLVKDVEIQKIKFGKKYFKVKFKKLSKYIPYEYYETEVIIFLEDLEALKNEN